MSNSEDISFENPIISQIINFFFMKDCLDVYVLTVDSVTNCVTDSYKCSVLEAITHMKKLVNDDYKMLQKSN